MEKKYKYIIDLLLQAKGFNNNINKVQGQIRGLENTARRARGMLLQMGGALGFTYGIAQVTQLVQQSIQLAAKAEGIKAAFDKLNQPGLLRELEKATRGTVSNIELMSKTIQARNFKISMESLPTYFKFATQRALETGQAADYLVESLVVGVGRKSVLWLDNLGLSVVEINKELKKTPDFAQAVGQVIEREMKAAGDVADTTATEIQSITASWENLKLSLGESILSKGGAVELTMLADWITMLSSSDLTGGQKIVNWINLLLGGDNIQQWKDNKKAAEEYFAALDKANTIRYIQTYSKEIDQLDAQGKALLLLAVNRYKAIKAEEDAKKATETHQRTLEDINTDIQMYNELVLKTPVADKASIKSHLEKIKALEAEKKALLALADVIKKVTAPGKAVIPGTPKIGRGKTPSSVAEALGVDPDKLAGAPQMSSGLDNMAEAARKVDVELYKLADSMALLKGLENPFEFLKTSLEEMEDVLAAGGESWAEYAASVGNAVREIIADLLAKSVANAIANAIEAAGWTGPLAVAMIPVLTAVATGLTKTAFKSLVPGFAEGALAYGPTLAMIGEYPSARQDPELVTPVSKLQGLIQPALTEGKVTFHIGERELVGILVRAERVRKNIRGG